MASVLAEVGSQRQHLHCLRNLIGSTKGVVRVASAYVTDSELLCSVKRRKVKLLTSLVRMDIASGATSLSAIRRLVGAGVQCRALSDGPRLHAKVYLFGDNDAVVTSANLTQSALESNLEVGIQLNGHTVQKLAEWFDAIWTVADPIDLAKVSEWEQETADLRREFARLRVRAGRKRTLPSETFPYVRSQPRLRDLLNTATRFFVCNTNRRWSDTLEGQMRQRRFAAVWEEFRYPAHMGRVRRGDVIFMFAKGVGVIGIGRAKAGCEVLGPNDRNRIRKPDDYDALEWRVSTDEWLAWVENDADACRVSIPNVSFIDASGDAYAHLRESVRKHFIRDARS